MKQFTGGKLPGDEWFGQQAVYRISIGNFLLFGGLAAVMLGVRYKGDRRDAFLHHGSWLLKAGLWLLAMVLPFFFPNGLVNAYGEAAGVEATVCGRGGAPRSAPCEASPDALNPATPPAPSPHPAPALRAAWLARFGSPLFLVLQMVILLDLSQAWNDAWVEEGERDERFLYALLGATAAAYASAATAGGLLYYWFAPGGHDCSFNVAVVTVAMALCLAFTMVSLHPKARGGGGCRAAGILVCAAPPPRERFERCAPRPLIQFYTPCRAAPQVERGSLFPAACLSLYVMYMCYSALQSEPHDYECNRLGQRLNAASAGTLATGMLLTLLRCVCGVCVCVVGGREGGRDAAPLAAKARGTLLTLRSAHPSCSHRDHLPPPSSSPAAWSTLPSGRAATLTPLRSGTGRRRRRSRWWSGGSRG